MLLFNSHRPHRQVLEAALEEAGLTPANVDWLLLHQVSGSSGYWRHSAGPDCLLCIVWSFPSNAY